MLINNCISNFIKLPVYQSIFGSILTENYTYIGKTMKIMGQGCEHYYNMLVKKGVIEQRQLTHAEKQELLCQNGFNTYNANKLKAYDFTFKYKEFFNMQTIKKFILDKLTYIQGDKVKKFLFDCKRKLNNIQLKHKLKKQLQGISINSIGSKILNNMQWQNFNINNAYDFMCVKIRKISEFTGLTKGGLERLEQLVSKLVGVKLKQLRTLITTRTKTNKWEKSQDQEEIIINVKTNNVRCDDFTNANEI